MTDATYCSLEDMLEIVLVTHNRASSLDKILCQFAESPIRNIRISVFDNCSCDATQDVCQQYAAILPQLSVVRHRKYIGEDAACLQAVESLRVEYGWLLCDDACYDFSLDPDLIRAIKSNDYSAFFVGARAVLEWNGDSTCDMAQLVATGTRLFASFSSWPTLIFRTSLFDEECLVKGYRLVNNIYWNFPFLNALLDSNAKIYVSQRQQAMPKEGGLQHFSDLYRYAAWVNCCQSIKNISLREMMITDATASCGLLSAVSAWIACDYKFGSIIFWNAVVDIVWGAPTRQRRMLLVLCALMIAPLPRSWRHSLFGWIGVWATVARIPA